MGRCGPCKPSVRGRDKGDMTSPDSELDIEYQNILTTVRAGHISEREGFDYYKAFRNGDAEKVETMRKEFQARLKSAGGIYEQ